MIDHENDNSRSMTDRFTFFKSYWVTASRFKTGKVRLEYLEAIINYAFEGTEPDFEESMKKAISPGDGSETPINQNARENYIRDYAIAIGAWDAMKPNIHANVRRIQDGLKGGRPQKNKNT